jgi:hypothetical protein
VPTPDAEFCHEDLTMSSAGSERRTSSISKLATLDNGDRLRNADEITPVPSGIFFAWAAEEAILDICPLV